MTTAAGPSLHPHLIVVGAVVIGVASLAANIVWNCNSCGWDLDGVPWYQALLVAAVPFVVSPIGVVGLAIRAAFLRSRPALIDLAEGSGGLALPWLYYAIAAILYRS